MSGLTFTEELEAAEKRLGKTLRMEAERVHRKTVRDRTHAFRNTDMRGPEPWKYRTDLTIGGKTVI